jgi:hypothetical protein
MVNPNRFYTYAYLREDKTPYYVGKGKEDRAYYKRKGEVYPPKDKSRIILLKQNLTEEEAFKHEIYMISVFGRKDLGTGILYNRTNGGDGSSGFIHSEESKRKMSAANKGKTPVNKGGTHTPEAKAKIAAAQKGRTHSPEHRAKNSAANKGEKHHNYGKTLSPKTKMKQSSKMKGRTSPKKGKMYITNEIVNLMIPKNDIIPEGFRKGKKHKE